MANITFETKNNIEKVTLHFHGEFAEINALTVQIIIIAALQDINTCLLKGNSIELCLRDFNPVKDKSTMIKRFEEIFEMCFIEEDIVEVPSENYLEISFSLN